MTEFNHIHDREDGDWVCGRTMAFDDQELAEPETGRALDRSEEHVGHSAVAHLGNEAVFAERRSRGMPRCACRRNDGSPLAPGFQGDAEASERTRR